MTDWTRGPANDMREIWAWLAPLAITQWLIRAGRAFTDMVRSFGPPDFPVLTDVIETSEITGAPRAFIPHLT